MEIKTVKIPATVDHAGIHAKNVILVWVCPKCGIRRGKPFQTFSFDGSRRLVCDGWVNPCGHVDLYKNVRKEARENGLNPKN